MGIFKRRLKIPGRAPKWIGQMVSEILNRQELADSLDTANSALPAIIHQVPVRFPFPPHRHAAPRVSQRSPGLQETEWPPRCLRLSGRDSSQYPYAPHCD